MKKKWVIYTSITNNYDSLPQPNVIDDAFDYICFTNDYPEGSFQGVWLIQSIPIKTNDKIRRSRFVKLLPHQVLNKYDYSLWMDSNIKITTSHIYDIIKTKIKQGGKWYGVKHPIRDCIYDEAIICIKDARSGLLNTKQQIRFLKKNKYPPHYGLFENNIILRKHNDEIIKSIDETWWSIFKKYTKRDQLSLFFVFWLNSFLPDMIFDEGISCRNFEGLSYLNHSKPPILKRAITYMRRKLNKYLCKIITI